MVDLFFHSSQHVSEFSLCNHCDSCELQALGQERPREVLAKIDDHFISLKLKLGKLVTGYRLEFRCTCMGHCEQSFNNP